ncbi:DUF418 domain-containing protein [Paenibacillus sp. L3-i20]|uniref:DUF418 domain-containing protein n=1 Tax=Paenibacillus sp. L3-i20 TaxID=2905833 RepID=UPI001EDF6352|nr:DUF418 domain-containing protein [Paenibacillus sp. L3-i20]GKU76374.1 hypothetical protein L3i20_v207710 [Paenibacillus sp. L3-i20]
MKTTTANRQTLVDILRGVSLLGILLANVVLFQYGAGIVDFEMFDLSEWDKNVDSVMDVLIHGSFVPIFTFLFGFGIFKMKENLEARGQKWRLVIIRRCIMMLGLGFLHFYFLWQGDILRLYGFLGLLLFGFLARKSRTVLIGSIIGYVVLIIIGLSLNLLTTDQLKEKRELTITQLIESEIPVFSSGTYWEIFHHSGPDSAEQLSMSAVTVLQILLLPFGSLTMFLLGIYAAKRSWFTQPETKRRRYGRGALLFLPLGLLIKTLHGMWPDSIFGGITEYIGPITLAIGYLFTFAWILSGVKNKKLLYPFEAVGKLSLTNYLMQSVICTTIFYGYGFGYYGKLGLTAGIGIALVIYALQLLFSVLYLKYFKMGPVERLLRIWTYWSLSGSARKAKARNDGPTIVAK